MANMITITRWDDIIFTQPYIDLLNTTLDLWDLARVGKTHFLLLPSLQNINKPKFKYSQPD